MRDRDEPRAGDGGRNARRGSIQLPRIVFWRTEAEGAAARGGPNVLNREVQSLTRTDNESGMLSQMSALGH
jgi:hypothetical protein